MKNNERQILKDAVELWGEDAQRWMAIEEMGELIKAIAKFKRDPCDATFNNVCDEIADVSIMIDQLTLMTGPVGQNKIEKIRQFKIQRLDERINKSLKENGIDPGIRNPQIK